MKRLVFYSILILVFLATCKPFEPGEANDTPDAERPAVNQGTASVTIHLDGNGRAASRAMNRTFSEMGCDYFEVVFKYNKNNNGTYETAIGQWRIGERAGVSGVWRDVGVDYTGVSFAPATGKGSAILLAGKSDRTLMAIGKLSLVDEKAASSTNLINSNTKSVTFDLAAIKAGVNADFELAANKGLSSFLTAAGHATPGSAGNVSANNTLIAYEEIMGIYFLAFKLNSGVVATKAQYTFRLHSGASGVPGGPSSAYTYADFGDYVTTGGGLRVKSAGIVEKKYPSYTTSEGGNINVDSIILLDERTGVKMDNNQTVGDPFDPIVEFTFNTAHNTPNTGFTPPNGVGNTFGGSIFALVFEIPVYALDDRCSWFIRPGYGVLKYELDDGLGGMGGAVLIKTGELVIPASTDNFKIEIKKAPAKWRYRWDNAGGEGSRPAWQYDRKFRFDGLEVQLQKVVPNGASGDGEPYTTYTPATVFDNTAGGNPTTAIIAPGNLTYIIGKEKVGSGNSLADEFYGLVEVTVRFTDSNSGVSAEDKFFILVSGHLTVAAGNPNNQHNSTDQYDYADLTTMGTRLTQVGTVNNANDFMNAVQGAANNYSKKITIIRLTGSFDMSDAALNLNANIGSSTDVSDSTLIMIVATATGVTLGRQSSYNGGGTRINIRGARSGLAAFYFGKWPFDGLVDSPGVLNNSTEPFVVHAAGTVANANRPIGPSAQYSNKMITDGTTADRTPAGGGIYNVDIDPKRYDTTPTSTTYPHIYESGVTIHFPNILH